VKVNSLWRQELRFMVHKILRRMLVGQKVHDSYTVRRLRFLTQTAAAFILSPANTFPATILRF